MDNLDRLNLQDKLTRGNFTSGRQGKRKKRLKNTKHSICRKYTGGEGEKMKKYVVVILICLLLAFTSCKTADTTNTTTMSPSEKQLQSQIDDLTSKVFAFNTAISQLRAQLNSTATNTTAAQSNQDAIDALNATVTDLNDSINTLQKNIKTTQTNLQAQMKILANSLQAASTSIGITPVTLNGLSISFITGNITTETTGSTIPNAAQFAIKIVNTNSSDISNVDVTGTITCSNYNFLTIASNYPQLIDGTTLCSYAFSIGGSGIVNFEAYGASKTSFYPGSYRLPDSPHEFHHCPEFDYL